MTDFLTDLTCTSQIDWNKRKSILLLTAYGEANGYESGTEEETTDTAKRARLHVGTVLGVSRAQIAHVAQMRELGSM